VAGTELPTDHRLVFLGGLHRSGTTLLARCLADHPLVSGFKATGVPADEGQLLQTVYPPAYMYGGPGRFAFAKKAHLDEASLLVSKENQDRLMSEWSRHWDLSRPLLLEKSPPNLIRTRFLQALFPGSDFIMILRHPIAVGYATQKWSRTTIRSLIRHWVVAHETFAADRPHIENLLVLRYERLVSDPEATLGLVHAFLGLEPRPAALDVRPGRNDAYIAAWRKRPRFYRRLIEWELEGRVRAFGYSLRDVELVGDDSVTQTGSTPATRRDLHR
jgi:hypothetical protein